MAKAGVRRLNQKGHYDNEDNDKSKNNISPVPEIQGKAKTGNKKA